MNGTRTVPLDIHGAIEVFLAPAIVAAAFVLGLGTLAIAISVVIGVAMLGSAVSLVGEGRTVSLSAHAGFDYALAYIALVGGIVAGIAGDMPGLIFLAGVGAVQALLTAMTRFSLAPHGS